MDSRYVEPAEKLRGSAALEDDRENDDEAGGREHGLPGLGHGVAYGQGEAHGATQPGEEQHVLEVEGYLGLAAEVQEERQRVHVGRPAQQRAELRGRMLRKMLAFSFLGFFPSGLDKFEFGALS